jgi:hypothetical protein
MIVPIRRAAKVINSKIGIGEDSKMHPNMSYTYMERIVPVVSSRRIFPAVLFVILITHF